MVAFTHQSISLPGRVLTAHWTTSCVGPTADLEALKMEQFFAISGDQHTVPFLSNQQPNHYIDYATPPADPQLLTPEIISTDKGHAVTLPLSIVIFHHIPLHLLKKAYSGMIPIPDTFRSDMSSYEGTFFDNICMRINFSEVTDNGNNNAGHILTYYELSLLFSYPLGSEVWIHLKGKKKRLLCVF